MPTKQYQIEVPSHLRAIPEILNYIKEQMGDFSRGGFIYRAFDETNLERILSTGIDRDNSGCTQPRDAEWVRVNNNLEANEWMYATPELNVPLQIATQNYMFELLNSEVRVPQRAIAVYAVEQLYPLINCLNRRNPKPIFAFKNPSHKNDALAAIFTIKRT